MTRISELTPRGRGGVSVLLLDGKDALEALARLAPGLEKPGRLLPGGPPRVVRLRAGDEELDEALVWQRMGGGLELHLHGSPVLVARVQGLLEGEASSAVFLGGLAEPLGQLEERASALLPRAETRAAARLLLDQAEGALRRALERWRAVDAVEQRGLELELRERGRVAQHLLAPPRVVLLGPVNAGKSTLFNLLVGHERVVVSGVPGTTRDVIGERANLGAFAVELVDTAGAREAEGSLATVEAQGQRQALAASADADLVFWISRGERPPPMATPVVEFFGRADEPSDTRPPVQRLPSHPSRIRGQPLPLSSGPSTRLSSCPLRWGQGKPLPSTRGLAS